MKSISKVACLILLCSLNLMQAGEALDALQGTWKSDKDGTISELKKNEWWTEKRLAGIESLLGKLVVRYDGKTVFAKMEEWDDTYKVIVLRENGMTIEFEWEVPGVGKQRSKIEIFGDHLWVTPGGSEVFRERFVRMKEKSEPVD